MNGAGDGNRTHATSLEGWGSTIELHPHIYLFFAKRIIMISSIACDVNNFFQIFYFIFGIQKNITINILNYISKLLHCQYFCDIISKLTKINMRIWRNGRRASLRCLWGDPCWFKSSYPHQNDTLIGIFFCTTGLECALAHKSLLRLTSTSVLCTRVLVRHFTLSATRDI